MTFDRQGSEKREWPVDSLFISKSFRSVNLARSTAERDGGAGAVSSLQRYLGHQRFASVKVCKNKEAKEAAANRPKTKLPSLAQQDPIATGPCIAPPPPPGMSPSLLLRLRTACYICLPVWLPTRKRGGQTTKSPSSLTPPPAPSDPLGVDASPNPANRLKRARQEEALRQCDFLDPESIM
jgi:hypothetical protein